MNQVILTFCEKLQPSDWQKMATETRTVKGVLAHLVGWQREVSIELLKSMKPGESPWFVFVEDYDDFNAKIDTEFNAVPPEGLLREFRKWDAELDRQIQSIGIEKLRERPEAEWVLDKGDDSHFLEHFNQMKKAVDTPA